MILPLCCLCHHCVWLHACTTCPALTAYIGHHMPSRAIQVNYSIEKVAKSFIIFWLWTTRRCFPSQEIRYVISSLIDPSRFLWCLVLQLCAVARRLYQQQKNKGNHHQQLKEQEQPPSETQRSKRSQPQRKPRRPPPQKRATTPMLRVF